MNANQPCIDANGKTFWPKIHTMDAVAPIQSLQDQDFQFLSLMEPLRQAPAVIPQIIMSLCAV